MIIEDNQGTIAMAKNPVSHVRTKDIDIRYHYVREAVQDGVINLHYCSTEEMIADMLTQNHSPVDNLRLFRQSMGLESLPTVPQPFN